MKLIIDNIIFYWQRSGGISVVWNELIKRFLKNQNDGRIALEDCGDLELGFIDYDNSSENKFRNSLNIPASFINKVISHKGMIIKRYLSQPFKCREKFLFHSSYYRTCCNKNAINVITIHDFTYELFQHGVKKFIHRITKNRAIRKADYVICISENTKKDLLELVDGVDEKKVFVIYNGVSDTYRLLDDGSRYKEGDKPYLVFVGGRDGYKNFEVALNIAKQSDMRLKIVGRKLSEEEQKHVADVLENNYEDLGFVSDEELNSLYNKAFALIYPSSYEGFGLPVIEAQRAGCPVLALNKSSIPEIIGNKEILVADEAVSSFIEKIDKLKNLEFRKRIIADGIENSNRFSWDNTYKGYLEIYKLIMKGTK